MEKFKRLRQQLRQLLDNNAAIKVPGAHDPLSAMLVESSGFPVVYVGSYGVSSAKGLPDVGLLTLDEMVAAAAAVANAVNIPVLADAENGFFQPANIWRMVRAYEQAGIAGIHIDDHVSGKHSALPPKMLTQAQLITNLQAALDARTDPNFLIIGRTDIAWATRDPEQAVQRMIAMHEAGADLVFPTGLSPRQFSAVRARLKGKVVRVHTESATDDQESNAGIAITIYYSLCLYAAARGVKEALSELLDGSFHQSSETNNFTGEELEHLLDYRGYEFRGRRFADA